MFAIDYIISDYCFLNVSTRLNCYYRVQSGQERRLVPLGMKEAEQTEQSN